jgi:acyl-coenzyme A thioesterase PaaI-like protein
MNFSRILRQLGFMSEVKRLELYPLFWVMRVKVVELSHDWRVVRIKLPLNWLTKNSGGFMFGGCQATLADPIAALSCARVFKGFSVWTRALVLDFLQEGSTDLELRFTMSVKQEAQIRTELNRDNRSTPMFEFGYFLEDGTRCTTVQNTVAIRPKGYKKPRVK